MISVVSLELTQCHQPSGTPPTHSGTAKYVVVLASVKHTQSSTMVLEDLTVEAISNIEVHCNWCHPCGIRVDKPGIEHLEIYVLQY